MSTGDLKNNLQKLQAEVKSIKYEKDVDYHGLSRGLAAAYLPLYHYAFVDYSPYVAQLVVSCNTELTGKTDLRFVESMYKVLRDVFNYKPPITKDQFFSAGFVERKIIMCTEILVVVRNKHRELKPRDKVKTTVLAGTKQPNKAQGRVASASSGTGLGSHMDTGTGDKVPRPHVVNELKATAASGVPPSQVGSGILVQNKPSLKSTGSTGNAPHTKMENLSGHGRSSPPVYTVEMHHPSPPFCGSSFITGDTGPTPTQPQASAGCTGPRLAWGSSSVHVWERDGSQLEENVFDPPRPIDLVAHTPARGALTSGCKPAQTTSLDTSLPPLTQPVTPQATLQNIPQVTQQWVEELVRTRTQELETRVNNLQATVVLLQHQMSMLQKQQQLQLQPQQFSATNQVAIPDEGSVANGLAPSSPLLPSNSAARPNGYDPKLYTSGKQVTSETAGESVTHASSIRALDTPVTSGHSSLENSQPGPLPSEGAEAGTEKRTVAHTTESHPEKDDVQSQQTQDSKHHIDGQSGTGMKEAGVTEQAKRINDLLKSTEGMLNIQVLSPVKQKPGVSPSSTTS